MLADTVGQLRWLNRQACIFSGTIRSQRCRRCKSCGFDTPLRELRVGDTFQDRRQPGHQDAAASGTAFGQQLPQSSQPVPPGEPLDDSPLPDCPIHQLQNDEWTTGSFMKPLARIKLARKTALE